MAQCARRKRPVLVAVPFPFWMAAIRGHLEGLSLHLGHERIELPLLIGLAKGEPTATFHAQLHHL